MKKFYVACAVLLAVAFPGAQGKRFITEKDLFRFTWIADPQLSPDGSTVAFVRVTVNEKENRYETSLFAVPSSGAESPRRLTANIRGIASSASHIVGWMDQWLQGKRSTEYPTQ